MQYSADFLNCVEIILAGEEKLLSSRDVTKYFNIVDQLSWSRFDEYVDHIGTLHYVNFSKKKLVAE